MREAPALDIIRELAKQGAVIQAYDPIAVENLIQ
ncbi:UDP binding domain-containing protein [Desulfitibacter alkalitolerans]